MFFELFPCLLGTKQNGIKELKELSKQGTNTRRQTEPYEQWIFQRSYMFKMLSCSEKRYSLICLVHIKQTPLLSGETIFYQVPRVSSFTSFYCVGRNDKTIWIWVPNSIYSPHQHYKPKLYSIRSDEGLTLETSAFESLYGG